MRRQVARPVIVVAVGACVRVDAANHPSEHVIRVEGADGIRVGALLEPSQAVILEPRHSVHGCNLLELLSERAGKRLHGVVQRVGHGGAEAAVPAARVEAVHHFGDQVHRRFHADLTVEVNGTICEDSGHRSLRGQNTIIVLTFCRKNENRLFHYRPEGV